MLKIRNAAIEDTPLIFDFIRALAEFERLAHAVHATEDLLRESLFGIRPFAECVIAEWEGAPAGFALFFHNFSTFAGRPGIYLEDLFVKPEHRGKGIGKALLIHLAGLCRERGCARLEWAVLDWNERAIGFYQGLGAKPKDEWTIFRVSGDELQQLAARA